MNQRSFICLTASILGLATTLAAETRPVYFGTGGPGAEGIYRADFNSETGKLTAAGLAHRIGNPGFLALHPDGTKLYAVATMNDTGGVAAYRIAAGGALEFFHFEPTGDGSAAHLAVHPSGKFLLTAQYGGGSVSLLPLDGEGKPGTATVTKHEGGSGVVTGRQDSPHPHWCGYSPDGKFALIPDLGLDGIVIYAIDPDRPSVTRHGFAASVPGGGPRHMRFSNDGRFIYLLNELSLSVSVFRWDATDGSAGLLSDVPTLGEETKAAESFNSAAEILVHPTGPYVYTSNRGHDSVTVFRIRESDASLEVIQTQPIRGAFPRNINLDPGGKWLLTAGADSHTVAVHAVDSRTGRLTYQRASVIHVPAPICILFGPAR
ncbi:MAG TPA: lactonase family protein [Luteolibacter sp.]|nr:lactonase family protein [Luteolibacter sp.]